MKNKILMIVGFLLCLLIVGVVNAYDVIIDPGMECNYDNSNVVEGGVVMQFCSAYNLSCYNAECIGNTCEGFETQCKDEKWLYAKCEDSSTFAAYEFCKGKDQFCDNGECVSCVEEGDNQDDHYDKGCVTYVKDGVTQTECDYCMGNEKSLAELFCDRDDEAGAAVIHCTYGCDDGRCLEEEEPVVCAQDAKECTDGSYVGRVPPDCEFEECPELTCSETDDGEDYTKKGTSCGFAGMCETDYCQDDDYLFEYYFEDECSPGPSGLRQFCPHGCEEGACVKRECNCENSDFNNDGQVDLDDMELMKTCFKQESVGDCAIYDFDADGLIQINDLSCVGARVGCMEEVVEVVDDEPVEEEEVDELPSVCTDTDGGRIPGAFGEATSTDGSRVVDSCATSGTLNSPNTEVDWCDGDGCYLLESECVNGKATHAKLLCKQGCEEGICRDNGHVYFDTLHLFPGDYVIQQEDCDSEETCSYFFADVRVTSTHSQTLNDVSVIMSIPELGLEHSQVIDSLKPNFGTIPDDQYHIDLPQNVASGVYEIQFTIKYKLNGLDYFYEIASSRGIANAEDIGCGDNDGDDYYNKGKTTLYLPWNQNDAAEDSCCNSCNTAPSETGKYVSEYVCEGNLRDREIYECPDGCEDGACINDSVTDECEDSDEGYSPYVKGQCESRGSGKGDYCSYTNGRKGVLKEAYCGTNECLRSDHICNDDEICRSGKCIKGDESEPICVDTDNANPYVKGDTTARDRTGGEDSCYISKYKDKADGPMTSKCWEGMPGMTGYCGVYEYYCNDEDYSATKFTFCENGCEDGGCIKKEDTIVSCYDSDGKDNFDQRGYIHLSYSNGSFEKKYDSCGYSSGGSVFGANDYWCAEKSDGSAYYYKSTRECEYGCEDGVCVEEPTCDMRVDLSDYPDYFYEDGEFDTFIIYSEYEDVTKYYAEELAEKFNTDMIYSSNEDHYWIKSPKHYRIISLGSPCVNAVSARLKDNPEQCNEDLQENMGKITLLENNGYPQMIIEGHDDYMRLHALKVLLDMDDSLLKGTEWEVTSSDSSSLSVEKLNDKKVTLGDCDSGGSSGGGDGSSGGGSPGPVCYSGCRSNGNCLEFGTRMVNAKTKAPVYCELDKLFKDQKQIGEVCQNNYECLSNSCYGGECTDLAGQIEETNSLIRQIFNWLKYLFSLN